MANFCQSTHPGRKTETMLSMAIPIVELLIHTSARDVDEPLQEYTMLTFPISPVGFSMYCIVRIISP